MIYRPRNFIIQELISPKIFRVRGELAWELLNPMMLRALQDMRDFFGPLEVNTWHFGGTRDSAGLRDHDDPEGAEWSLHKYGAAVDPRPLKVTPQEVHAYILAHSERFPYVTTMEDIAATPTWVHIDVRNNGPEWDRKIRVVKP